LAATSLLALSAPAFAQNAGAPGATGTGGSLTGSNTGTGFGPSYGGNWDQNGPGPNGGYNNGYNGGYMNEGRAAAPDMEPTGPDSPPVYAPQRRGGEMDDQR